MYAKIISIESLRCNNKILKMCRFKTHHKYVLNLNVVLLKAKKYSLYQVISFPQFLAISLH